MPTSKRDRREKRGNQREEKGKDKRHKEHERKGERRRGEKKEEEERQTKRKKKKAKRKERERKEERGRDKSNMFMQAGAAGTEDRRTNRQTDSDAQTASLMANKTENIHINTA